MKTGGADGGPYSRAFLTKLPPGTLGAWQIMTDTDQIVLSDAEFETLKRAMAFDEAKRQFGYQPVDITIDAEVWDSMATALRARGYKFVFDGPYGIDVGLSYLRVVWHRGGI